MVRLRGVLPNVVSLSMASSSPSLINGVTGLTRRVATSTEPTPDPPQRTNEANLAIGALQKESMAKRSAFNIAPLPPQDGLPTLGQMFYLLQRNLPDKYRHGRGIVFSAGINRKLTRSWMHRRGLASRDYFMGLAFDLSQVRNSKELRSSYRARATVVVAMFAEDPVYVVLGSDQDGQNPQNSWNKYARPVLQGRKRQIIWMDNNGRERNPVYPLDVIPPEEEVAKSRGVSLPPVEYAAMREASALMQKIATLIHQKAIIPQKHIRPPSESDDSGRSSSDEFHIEQRQRKARM